VEFASRVFAEWPLLRARLLRTRLGVWLVLLLAVLWRLERTSPRLDPLGAATLGAVLCVAALSGSRADRAALAHRLLQPTSPPAVAVGRWLAALAGASVLVLAVAVQAGVGAAIAGLSGAAAMSACALALVLIGGNALAVVAFGWLLLVSGVPPEAVLGPHHADPASLVTAGLLEIGPSIWRYRGIATGDLGALAHAAVWVGFGLLTATWRVRRLGSRGL
jgi:hypothetical protein